MSTYTLTISDPETERLVLDKLAGIQGVTVEAYPTKRSSEAWGLPGAPLTLAEFKAGIDLAIKEAEEGKTIPYDEFDRQLTERLSQFAK